MNFGAPAGIDKFSETTREAVQLAKALTIEFKHTHITPEHMLLGLLKLQCGELEKAMSRAQATPAQIRELILHHIRPGDDEIPEALIGFSERGKRVIEAARQEAQRMRAPLMSPVHLLLGLTLVPNTVSGAVLRAVGLTTETVRAVLDGAGAPA